MTSSELKSYNKLVTSNNSFCHALKDNKIVIDNNIKFELIIYYLILNKKYLVPELTEYYEDILYLITHHNYTISDEYILVNSTSLSLDYLVNLVNRIEQLKQEKEDRKVIYLSNRFEQNNPRPTIRKTGGKVLEFKDSSRMYYYTSLERAQTFESNPEVSDETISYITATKRHFLELMNDIIIRILNDNIKDYSIKYLKVISIYLSLYAITNYRKDTPYQDIYLPMSQIGLRKTTHTNQEILSINRRLKDLNVREAKLENDRERYELNPKIKASVLTQVEQEIIELQNERTSLNFRAYLLAHSPEIYNENLLTYLRKSFEQGYVEINRFFANPIIKLFYIENRQVEFHCSARLDTLTNLFELERIDEKRLRKEV